MAGYNRSFSKTNGTIIDAPDFVNEYEAVDIAFDKNTGHRHDGTSNGEGALIALISSPGGNNQVEAVGIGNKIIFSISVLGVKTAQVEIYDGVILPVTDADIDLGSGSKRFKNIYGSGTANLSVLELASGSPVSAILDEDDFLSNSDVAIATQQSIKAYVDTTVSGSTGVHVHDGVSASIVNFVASNDQLNVVEIDDANNRVLISTDLSGVKTNKLTISGSAVLPFTDLDIALGGPANKFTVAWAQTIRADNLQFALGVSVDSILDEDDLLSNSASALVTQQSIKAYIDTKIAADILSHNHTGGSSPTLNVIQSPDGFNRVSINDASNRVVFQVDVASVATSKAAVDASALFPATDLDIDLGKIGNRFTNVYAQTLLPTNQQFGIGVSVDRILDEDDLISNSASALVTQQSVKAYVDTGLVVKQTVPATTLGTAGDLAGMIAADSSFVYTCHTNFDGITPIWVRVAVTTW